MILFLEKFYLRDYVQCKYWESLMKNKLHVTQQTSKFWRMFLIRTVPGITG